MMPSYQGKFDYLGENGAVLSQGACHLSFEAEEGTVTPVQGVPLAFDLGDVDRVAPGEWDVRLTFYTGRTLALRHFGPAFGRMSQELLEAWRDRTVQCLLLEDLEELARFNGTAAWNGAPAVSEIRLFGSNLAVLPEAGLPLQLRLADIDKVEFDERAYAVTINSGAERVVISKLGKKTDEFRLKLGDALKALREQSALALRRTFPFLSPDQLQRLVAAMPEGRSVSLTGLAGIHAKLADALLERAVGASLRPYFEELRSRSQPNSLMTGFKFIRKQDEESEPEPEESSEPSEEAKSETASETEEPEEDQQPLFFWFFFPLASGGAQAGVAAWEASTGSGRATYFFRLSGGAVEPAIASLTRGLALINFRREPIYLSDESLERQARFRRYAIGCRKLPDLRNLRAAMMGRAIHFSLERWKAQVESISQVTR